MCSSPALIKAFASLSSTNTHDAMELFTFLASMQAGFITGSTLNVEGGMLRSLA